MSPATVTLDDAPLVGPVAPSEVHVMSWNIRRTIATARASSPDFWPRRRPLMRAVLESERPTILATQEAMLEQAEDLSAMLGPHMRRIGRGRRRDGGGEGCPVWFDARRLRLERWTQLALSSRPAEPGSRGWGNLVPRIAVTAEFTAHESGLRFHVVNLHLDHLSRRSRTRSAEQIAALTRTTDSPVIVTGDFNTVPTSPVHRTLQGAGLEDTWLVAAERRGRDVGTYSGYQEPSPGGRRIDWIFARGLDVRVAAINAARPNGRAPSDHEPIHAVIASPHPAYPRPGSHADDSIPDG